MIFVIPSQTPKHVLAVYTIDHEILAVAAKYYDGTFQPATQPISYEQDLKRFFNKEVKVDEALSRKYEADMLEAMFQHRITHRFSITEPVFFYGDHFLVLKKEQDGYGFYYLDDDVTPVLNESMFLSLVQWYVQHHAHHETMTMTLYFDDIPITFIKEDGVVLLWKGAEAYYVLARKMAKIEVQPVWHFVNQEELTTIKATKPWVNEQLTTLKERD